MLIIQGAGKEIYILKNMDLAGVELHRKGEITISTSYKEYVLSGVFYDDNERKNAQKAVAKFVQDICAGYSDVILNLYKIKEIKIKDKDIDKGLFDEKNLLLNKQ